MTIKLFFILLISFSVFGRCYGLNIEKEVSMMVSKIQYSLLFGTPEQQINEVVSLINNIPIIYQQSLETVGDEFVKQYRKFLPIQCVQSIGKAVLMLDGKQSKKCDYSDTISIENFYELEIRPQCPLLAEVSQQNLKDLGSCLESAYRFSLIVESLHKDIKKADKAAVLHDIDQIITRLPETLEECNQNQWAEYIRKYLPLDCVHAVENLLTLMPQFIHHYAHIEWLAKNYPIYVNAGAMVLMQCPIFY